MALFCLDDGWRCDFTKMSNFNRENDFDGDSDFTIYSCFHRESDFNSYSDFTYYAILLILVILMR